MALICRDQRMLVLALFFWATHWLFIEMVEIPHVRRVYGDSLRARSGVEVFFDDLLGRIRHLLARLTVTPTLQVVEESLGLGDCLKLKVHNVPSLHRLSLLLLAPKDLRETISISDCDVEGRPDSAIALISVPSRHIIWLPGQHRVRLSDGDSLQLEGQFSVSIAGNGQAIQGEDHETFLRELLSRFGIKRIEDAVLAGPRHLLFQRLSEAVEARYNISWRPQELFTKCQGGLQSLVDVIASSSM